MAVLRYKVGMLPWKQSKLKDVKRKSKKRMTMFGALHPKSDVDRLYIKRKVGSRSLMSVERWVREEENSLSFYDNNSEENPIKGLSTAKMINTEDTVTSVEF